MYMKRSVKVYEIKQEAKEGEKKIDKKDDRSLRHDE